MRGSKASIITAHPDEIAGRIIRELDRSATILPGKGAYSGRRLRLYFVRSESRNLQGLKEFIHETDENAFVMGDRDNGGNWTGI